MWDKTGKETQKTMRRFFDKHIPIDKKIVSWNFFMEQSVDR